MLSGSISRPGYKRFFGALLIIVALGGAWRVAYAVGIKNNDYPGTLATSGDADWYFRESHMLSSGEGFVDPYRAAFAMESVPSAEHPPATATLFSISARLFDDGSPSVLAMRLENVLVGLIGIVLIGLLGKEIGGERVGLLAAALAVVYPNLWVNDAAVMSESFAIAQVAALMLATYRYLRAPNRTGVVVMGALVGIGALTRAELLLLGPLMVVPVIASVGDFDLLGKLTRVGVAGCTALVVIAPWSVYNSGRFDRPVLIATNGDITIGGANCDSTYSGPLLGLWDLSCVVARGDPAPLHGEIPDPSEVAEHHRRAGISYARNHVAELPKVALARIGRAWSVFRPIHMAKYNEPEDRELWVSYTGLAFFYPLAIMAVIGLLKMRKRAISLLPMLAVLVTATISAALIVGQIRVRAPAEVAIVVLAAFALDATIARRRLAQDEIGKRL